jgi:hypothetical protein
LLLGAERTIKGNLRLVRGRNAGRRIDDPAVEGLQGRSSAGILKPEVCRQLCAIRIEADAEQTAAGLLRVREPLGEVQGHARMIPSAEPAWRADSTLGSMLTRYREN